MRQRGDHGWKVCEEWEADCGHLSEGTIPVPAYGKPKKNLSQDSPVAPKIFR
jgi:hypothetical protein